MKDRDKDKEKLQNELMELRKEIAELERIKVSQKHTEEKLAKSEKLYRLITENTSDVITLHNFNLQATFTYISPSIKDFSSGYEPEELIGKSPFEFIHPGDKKKLFPILKNYISAKVKKLFVGKESPTTERIEFRFKDKEGSWRYIQSTGNIVGNQLLFITRDITNQKKAVEALRIKQQEFAGIFNSSPEALVYTDEKSNILDINPRFTELFGYTLEEIKGRNLDDGMIHSPDKIEEGKELGRIAKSKGYFICDTIRKKKDGTLFPVSISGSNITIDGQLKGMLVIYIDTTERKKLMDKLRKSEEKYRRLFDNMPGAYYRTDKEGSLVMINPAGAKMFGYEHIEDMLGKNVAQNFYFRPKERKKYLKRLEDNEGALVKTELILKKKNGDPLIVSDTSHYYYDKDGNIAGSEGNFIDITERKEAEEALQQSQQELANIFKNMSEALVYLDNKGTILNINPRFTELFGYTLDEIKGKNIDNGIIHSPKMFEEGKKITKKALKSYVNYETIRKRKDGSEFPVFISSAPIKIDNKLEGLITLYQDISERKKAEEELRHSEEKFAGIFKNIPEAAFYQDTKGTVTDINPRFTEVFGYTKEDIIGENIDKIGFYPKGKIKEGKNLTRKAIGKDLINFETVRQKKDDTLIPVRISSSFVKINDKVTGIIALYQDITEQKQSEKIQKVLYNISKATNSSIFLDQLYPIIHQELDNIIDTTNFYIALVDENKDELYFPYYIDKKDEKMPFVKFSTTNTLTTYVIKTGKSLLNNNKQYKEMINQGILTLMGSTTDKSIWLGVPLKVEDHVIGAMAVQSYTNPNLYSESDIKLMEFVSSQVATAIERKSSEEKIKHLSFHDSLTGLYNRAYFEEELERYNFPRYYPLSIVMLDVNGLKVINDTFGHQEGDRLLQHLAESLTSVSRQGDILARVGGDEFAILLPSTTSKEAHSFCERIKKVCQQDKIEPTYLRLNVSLGHATQEGEYKNINSLFKEADRNMYQDKLFNSKSREKHFLETFRIILAERDPHTSDHAQRLQELSLSLGKRVGLTEYQLGNLKLLALLHDIGKIGIPDSILFKTYILTPSEWEKMREHSRIGYRMAKNIPDFAPIAQDILHHHEHWDGTGYPDGLKGEKIPLLSRIISIIDAYDVMQSRRPYKAPISKTKALKEIERCAGTQFDPQLVEIFLKIVKNNASREKK